MKPTILKRFKLHFSLLLLLPFTTSAVAEDFTFTIPFSFHSVQGGTVSRIECTVYSANNDVLGSRAYLFQHPDLPDPDTFHNRNHIPVTLKFNAHPGKDASMATRYACQVEHSGSKSKYATWPDPSRGVREVYGAITRSTPLSRPLPPHSPIR